MKKITMLISAITIALTLNCNVFAAEDLFIEEIISEDIVSSIDEEVEEIAYVDDDIDQVEDLFYVESTDDVVMSADCASYEDVAAPEEAVLYEEISNDSITDTFQVWVFGGAQVYAKYQTEMGELNKLGDRGYFYTVDDIISVNGEEYYHIAEENFYNRDIINTWIKPEGCMEVVSDEYITMTSGTYNVYLDPKEDSEVCTVLGGSNLYSRTKFFEMSADGKYYYDRGLSGWIKRNNPKCIDVKQYTPEAEDECAFEYFIRNDEVSIIKPITRHNCKVIIPDYIDGYPVTAIEGWAFSEYSYSIDSIVFPSTLKSIGQKAFFACDISGELIIPEGVEIIRYRSFGFLNYGCHITRLSLPSTLKEIEAEAFYGSHGLHCDIIIPEGTEIIGQDAFNNCFNSENIVISSTVREIRTDAFMCYVDYKDYNTKTITNNSIVPVPLFGIGTLVWYDSEDEAKELMSVANGQTAIKSEYHYVAKMPERTIIAGQKLDLNEVFSDYLGEGNYRYIVDNTKLASVSKSMLTAGSKKAEVKVTAQEIIVEGRTKIYDDVAYCNVNILSKPIMSFPILTYPGQVIFADGYFVTDDTYLAEQITWQSTNSKVIKVIDADLGELEVIGEGTAKVYAYFGEMGKRTTVAIGATIKVKFPKFQKSSYTLKTGDNYILTMKNVNAATNVDWAVEDSNIANITPQLDKKGNPTGRLVINCLSCGDTKITATIDEQEYECEIHITAPKINKTKLNLKKGRTAALSLTNTKIKKTDVVWQSENDSIAVIENGKIKGISEGEVIIYTITGGTRNECTVKVVK